MPLAGTTPLPKNQKEAPQREGRAEAVCGSVMGADTIPQCVGANQVLPDNLRRR